MRAPLCALVGAAAMVVQPIKTHALPREAAIRHVRTTAYTPSERGGGGRLSAHGSRLHAGSAAADWSRFPFGTRFRVLGHPEVFVVEDYGSALVGTNTIDLYMPSHRSMQHWGVRHVDIEVLQMGSYQKSREILKPRARSRSVRKMLHELERR